MPWPSWEQAAIAALACGIGWLLLRRARPTRIGDAVLPALLELTLICGLYSVWRIARQLPFTHEEGALARARWIDDLQQAVHLPTEISMQHFAIDHAWLGQLANGYYATLHVPGLIVFLVWLFVRHRDVYPHWRNGLVAVTAGCLVIRFVRVAPPRFIEELGFVDLSARFGLGVYGDVGTGISDQYAAMPSIHVGWAAVVALGVFSATRSPVRWIVLMHLPVTVWVVAATGHHWWLDGAVSVVLLWMGLALDTAIRRRRPTGDRPDRSPAKAPDPL